MKSFTFYENYKTEIINIKKNREIAEAKGVPAGWHENEPLEDIVFHCAIAAVHPTRGTCRESIYSTRPARRLAAGQSWRSTNPKSVGSRINKALAFFQDADSDPDPRLFGETRSLGNNQEVFH